MQVRHHLRNFSNYNYILFWLSIYRAHAHLQTLKVLKYKSIKV